VSGTDPTVPPASREVAYALRNSVIVAGLTTLVALLIGVFASYALARLQFRGKKLVLGAVLATAMFRSSPC
jgi:multiple sugar transport system permease protein